MAVSVLSQASALNPGSDLWILPALNESLWTSKLDWYLNFQVCKASRHQTPRVDSYVTEVLRETEQGSYHFQRLPNAPLMIASEGLLPNKWVILVPLKSDLEEWTAEIHNIWSGLKHPTLRVFLPPRQSAGHFQNFWQKHSDFQEFTVVLD
ncbi:hypothetical protein D3C87_161890 [compost metagenome]